MKYKQLSLFGEKPVIEEVGGGDEYERFVDKFKRKKTTDDCYTPAPVYDVVLDWVRRNFDIEGKNIVRPFFPEYDYLKYPYGADDVVVDNPPFSILAKILDNYNKRGIKYFLFAPHMTLFNYIDRCCCVVAKLNVVYENGARVPTSFCTNLSDNAVICAGDLFEEFGELMERREKKVMKKINKPENVMTSAFLGDYVIPHGVHMEIPRNALESVRCISGITFFGKGAIIADSYWNIISENYKNHDFYKMKRFERMLKRRAEEMKRRRDEGLFLSLEEKEKRILKRLNENAGGKVG